MPNPEKAINVPATDLNHALLFSTLKKWRAIVDYFKISGSNFVKEIFDQISGILSLSTNSSLDYFIN